MRVLINSYSPQTPMSYGGMVRELWTRLAALGEFEVAQLAWYHAPVLEGVSWPLVKTLCPLAKAVPPSAKEDQHGRLTLPKAIQQFRPDLVWSLGDIYMMDHVPAICRAASVRDLSWSLVPFWPQPQKEERFLREATHVVAMTEFAASQWKRSSGRETEVIPAGVDTQVFAPVSHQERGELRQVHGGGRLSNDDFLILYVGRNQDRKKPWLPIQIVHHLREATWGWDKAGQPRVAVYDPSRGTHDLSQIVKRAEPVPAKLWLHSAADKERWDYRGIGAQWGLRSLHEMFATTQLSDTRGLSPTDMATVYQMADAVSMLSGAEGFGLPIIEAGACGVPSVATAAYAQGEVATSLDLPVVPLAGFTPTPGYPTWMADPDLGHAVQAFYEIAQRSQSERQERSQALRDRTCSVYDWQTITLSWAALLQKIRNQPYVPVFGALA